MHRDRYQRLQRMLEAGCPFRSERAATVICNIREYAIAELVDETDSAYSDMQLLHSICAGMGRYLQSYQAQPVFKQRLREKLLLWLHEIEKVYHLSIEDPSAEWPLPIQQHSGVEMVKLLHARTGITKTELAEKMGVSKKTIQNDLRRLDTTLYQGDALTPFEPLRLGGHEMHIKIRAENVAGSHGDQRYMTPNTLHPLVFQLNVTQVGAMLLALQQSYDNGIYGTYCLETALDLWCQLSEYCKDRIESVFASHNPDLQAFLEIINDELNNDRYPIFRAEREMLAEASESEQLLFACKVDKLCNITIKKNGVTTLYRKKRISKNNG